MSRRYSIYDDVTAAANQSIVGLIGATTQQAHIYELVVGSSATPADQAVTYRMATSTAIAGTSVSRTPIPLEIGGTASGTQGRISYTAEPTYTTDALLKFSLNQQATFRWVTASDEGIVMSANATAGVGVQVVSLTGGSPTVGANIHFAE